MSWTPLPNNSKTRTVPRRIRCLIVVVFVVLVNQNGAYVAQADSDSRGRSAAVALNYCRAAFHRIRRYQSKRVLIEEQDKILNNLDLNGIADEEVIRLYSAVLDEISQVQIADRERGLLKAKYKEMIREELAANAFLFATQFATTEFASAARTGVDSWWDYRELGWRRDLDIWKVDHDQMMLVVDKSSQFLDTFWKLTQKRNIPDRWLVRNDDLDKLESALHEPDLAVRLRILKRMERFMECYPPYWYHIARTEQSLGQLFAASATYDKLADLAIGHFRKDDMLAAALANQAAIQEYLQQPDAATTALESLRYSTDAWQANLMCAYVLEQHGLVDEAEDAILRNLDVGLEREQSLMALLSLYYQTEHSAKLMTQLGKDDVVQRVPIVLLLQCIAKLGTKNTPPNLLRYVSESLSAHVDLHFGLDDVVVVAAAGWHLNNARVSLQLVDVRYDNAYWTWKENALEVRFRGVLDLGSDLKPEPNRLSSAIVLLQFPDRPVIRVALQTTTLPAALILGRNTNVIARTRVRGIGSRFPDNVLRIAEITLDDHTVSFLPPVSESPRSRLLVPEPVLVRPVVAPAAETEVPGPPSVRDQNVTGNHSLDEQFDVPPPPPPDGPVSLRLRSVPM